LAFESAEELHLLLQHPANKKAQKGEAMLNYYDKISQVFWVSDNYLFHACAMQRIYNLTERQLVRKVNKGELSREDADKSLEMLASKVLLGALAVPPPPVKNLDGEDMDPEKQKYQRMAALVGCQTVPQRKSVINDIMGKNVMSNVPKELADLFNFVETEFDPLNLSKRVKPWFEAIEKKPELAKYLQALKHGVLLKLVQQLSQVYQTMRITDFAKLADFLSLHDCEKLIVRAVSLNQVSLSIG
jgi:translation initiation factor 3 subunit A